MRRRWLTGLVAAALVVAVGLWVLLWVLPKAVDPTWERILETGVLRVCTDPSWPPFEFLNQESAQIEGFDVDLARLLAERLATDSGSDPIVAARPVVRVAVVSVGFDSLYDALVAGRCDAILSAIPYEAMRTEDVAYSMAYFNAGLALLTRADESDIEVLDDLAERVVGVEWGFVPEGNSRQRDFLRNLSLRRYETAADALRALHAGEVDAAIVDRITALAYVRDCDGLRFAGEPLYDVNYVIPVHPDSFRLLEEINRVLLEMREDGTLEGLQEKWF